MNPKLTLLDILDEYDGRYEKKTTRNKIISSIIIFDS